MKLIVGLGNPGDEYRSTPHNLGFMVVDRIASERRVEIRNRQCRALTARIQVGDEVVLLAKPETYMNLSGVSVRELVAEYEAKPETDLIVIQDELDFPLGTQDFLRIRIGVAPERKVEDGQSYLLSPFRKAELSVVDGMLDTAAEAAMAILTDGAAAAMNRFNRKDSE